jgi:hypothetical protein
LLQWITTRNGGVVPAEGVTLYPEPTIFNDHPILGLTGNGRKLIAATASAFGWLNYVGVEPDS